MIVATIVSCITAVFVTSNGQLSILIPGEMFAKTYIKKGLQPKNLSRTLEDSATVVEPIVPWTAAGVYMATTLGVPTLSYLPWAVICYTGVIFADYMGIYRLWYCKDKTWGMSIMMSIWHFRRKMKQYNQYDEEIVYGNTV